MTQTKTQAALVERLKAIIFDLQTHNTDLVAAISHEHRMLSLTKLKGIATESTYSVDLYLAARKRTLRVIREGGAL